METRFDTRCISLSGCTLPCDGHLVNSFGFIPTAGNSRYFTETTVTKNSNLQRKYETIVDVPWWCTQIIGLEVCGMKYRIILRTLCRPVDSPNYNSVPCPEKNEQGKKKRTIRKSENEEKRLRAIFFQSYRSWWRNEGSLVDLLWVCRGSNVAREGRGKAMEERL
jgi:hypothetical protein